MRMTRSRTKKSPRRPPRSLLRSTASWRSGQLAPAAALLIRLLPTTWRTTGHVVSALKAAGSRRLGLATPDSPACGVLHIIAKEVFGMRNTTPSTFVEINKEISDRPIQMGDILPRRK